jgi:hypothetical protein
MTCGLKKEHVSYYIPTFYTTYHFYKTDQCFLSAEHVARKEINAYEVLAEITEGMWPLGGKK